MTWYTLNFREIVHKWLEPAGSFISSSCHDAGEIEHSKKRNLSRRFVKFFLWNMGTTGTDSCPQLSWNCLAIVKADYVVFVMFKDVDSKDMVQLQWNGLSRDASEGNLYEGRCMLQETPDLFPGISKQSPIIPLKSWLRVKIRRSEPYR